MRPSRVVVAAVALGLLWLGGGRLVAALPVERSLWYDTPALRWEEALPVGNGSFGALVFGDPDQERLLLGLDSLWGLPAPAEPPAPPAPAALAGLRQRLFNQGSDAALSRDFARQFGAPGAPARPQGLGSLEIGFHGQPLPLGRYRRSLSLLEGRFQAEWQRGASVVTEEIFASHPDQVLVLRYQLSNESGQAVDGSLQGLDLSFALADGAPDQAGRRSLVETLDGGILRLAGAIGGDPDGDLSARAGQGGLHYAVQALVLPDDGEIRVAGPRLELHNCHGVTVLLAADTSHFGDDPDEQISERLANAAGRSVDILRQRHVEDFTTLMGRTEIVLSAAANASESTAVRLEALRSGRPDPGLLALLFDYGRYLLVSSSRPGSLPAAGAALWLPPQVEGRPYQLDGPLPLSYSLAAPASLPECLQPLLDFSDRLAEQGAAQAGLLGARGWCAPGRSDAWSRARLAADGSDLSVHGGGWLLGPLWDQWAFGGDQDYLRNRLYPLLKGQCEFYLDWLVGRPGDGLLVSAPDRPPGAAADQPLSVAPAVAQQLITEVLDRCVESAELLGDDDPEFFQRLHEARARLHGGLTLDSAGRLRDQDPELSPTEAARPHFAALYAAYPSDLIARTQRSELLDGARASLEARLAAGAADHDAWLRGWSLGLLARCERGAALGAQAQRLAGESLHPNLLGGSPGLDLAANFTLAGGIAEALVQSHDGRIELLPAAPPEWSSGRVRGLVARGAFLVDFAWTDGKVTDYEVWCQGRSDCQVELLVNGQSVQVRARSANDRH